MKPFLISIPAALVLLVATLVLKPVYKVELPSDTIEIATEAGAIDQTDSIYEYLQSPEMPTHKVHVFSVIPIDNELLTIWYGGTKEARPDVSLYSSRLDPASGTWGPINKFKDNLSTGKETKQFTRLIGNATGIYAHNKVYLFYVSVGIGGWAVSSLNLIISEDKGATWGPAKKLFTSSFFNISTLVRNPPILLENGDLLLPTYFENGTKFSQALVVSPNGKIKFQKQLTDPSLEAIQADFIVQPGKLTGFYRSMNSDIPYLTQNTFAEGLSEATESIHHSNIFNADSGLNALKTNRGIWLIFYNHQPEGRESMDVAFSTDQGKSWKHGLQLEHKPRGKLGYPTSVVDHLGNYHLFYTVNRDYFRHIRFNDAWVDKLVLGDLN